MVVISDNTNGQFAYLTETTRLMITLSFPYLKQNYPWFLNSYLLMRTYYQLTDLS